MKTHHHAKHGYLTSIIIDETVLIGGYDLLRIIQQHPYPENPEIPGDLDDYALMNAVGLPNFVRRDVLAKEQPFVTWSSAFSLLLKVGTPRACQVIEWIRDTVVHNTLGPYGVSLKHLKNLEDGKLNLTNSVSLSLLNTIVGPGAGFEEIISDSTEIEKAVGFDGHYALGCRTDGELAIEFGSALNLLRYQWGFSALAASLIILDYGMLREPELNASPDFYLTRHLALAPAGPLYHVNAVALYKFLANHQTWHAWFSEQVRKFKLKRGVDYISQVVSHEFHGSECTRIIMKNDVANRIALQSCGDVGRRLRELFMNQEVVEKFGISDYYIPGNATSGGPFNFGRHEENPFENGITLDVAIID